MKKRLVFCFLILAIFLSACAATAPTDIPEPSITAEDLVGKTIDEAESLLVIDRNLLAYGHGFASDKSGNPVYFTWDLSDQDKIVITGADIFAAKETDNSPENFAKLHEGMTITEVVAQVGLPTSIPATGFFYISFTDSHGTDHWIVWKGDPLAISWIPEQEQNQ